MLLSFWELLCKILVWTRKEKKTEVTRRVIRHTINWHRNPMHSSVFSTWVVLTKRQKRSATFSLLQVPNVKSVVTSFVLHVLLWPCSSYKHWTIAQQTVHHLGLLNSSLKTTFSLPRPPVFNPPPCMPAFVSPETEKDSKCKLSPLGWEQPTDSSLPLWRTQGCLCKCQSHAAHSAVLHMLRSACCASTAWWKTQKIKKRNQVCSKNDKAKQTVPFLLPR